MQKLLGEHTCPKEIEAVVKEVDNNGDGTVDFEGKKTHIIPEVLAWSFKSSRHK